MLNLVIIACLPVFLSEALGKIQGLMGAKCDFFVSPLQPRSILREVAQRRSLESSPSEEISSYRSAGYIVLLIILDQSCLVLRSLHFKGEVSLTRTSVPAARFPLSHSLTFPCLLLLHFSFFLHNNNAYPTSHPIHQYHPSIQPINPIHQSHPLI
jgi:hypothetical protein